MAKVRGKASRAAKRAAQRVGSVYSVSSVAALECKRSAWTGLPNHCHQCNSELTGRRTAWCSAECHQTFELNHIWGEARKVILRQAKHTCQYDECKVKSDLQVNHIEPVVGQGYHPSCYHHLDNLEALCKPHHQLATNAQRTYRKENWINEAFEESLVLPHKDLPENLRQDLIKRMLDRKAGWPFIVSKENFDKTGRFLQYHPNTARKDALEDMKDSHKDALMWSSKEQLWAPVTL